MIIRPFEPEDIERFVLQPAQASLKPILVGNYGEVLASGEALTGIIGDRIIGCGGVVKIREGLGNAWAMFATDLRSSFIVVHRIAQRVLEVSTLQRIEAHVDCNFEAGHRWALKLGFVLEAPRMHKFTPDGRDAALYARIR